MYVYCVYPAMLKSSKQQPNCLKKAEACIVFIGSDGVLCEVRTYTVAIAQHEAGTTKSYILVSDCT
jgi:hypothetical protein